MQEVYCVYGYVVGFSEWLAGIYSSPILATEAREKMMEREKAANGPNYFIVRPYRLDADV